MTNILTPVAVWVGRQDATRENSHLVVGLDRWLDRISRGRVPLLRIAGLPTLVLHVPGRRSGVERSTPLLCASWGNGLVIVGSNWGGDSVPAWVHNLRAARPGTVATSVQGTRMLVDVRELSGAERAPAWGAAMRVWPNYAIYAGRTSRLIPVFHLTPRLDGPARQDA
ncbi:MAG TPA: nitroreductase family deazaflavin-dependent oxidoreductase [Candidatus Dietzia intestinipullorum]|nr:nitroreductase family deazaflavin-dependent oxidoreductase [Candidatus Dietzia intestinipullorum]